MLNEKINTGFYGLGIAPGLLKIIGHLKYETPTPIQTKAIPVAISGNDVVGIAQTGTGKTLAFAIPLLQRLAAIKGRGLILLPTRELAIQVEEVFHAVGRSLGVRTALLIGGAAMGPQLNALRRNPHVIIATPGRLLDHMNQKAVALTTVSVLILDEADRMLDMGFEPQIKRILASVPRDRQTMLFSATMPSAIAQIASNYMKLPIRVEIARPGTAAQNVSQEMIIIPKDAKLETLATLLQEYRGSVLVFSRTKHGARKITRAVVQMGHRVAEIHSNRSLNQRREAMSGFKSGKYRVLVATDIAARGIDVMGIELVINFDLPDNPEDYVHRIGRTGRAGMAGRAISFATPDQHGDIRSIERLIRTQIPISRSHSRAPLLREHQPSQRPARRLTSRRGRRNFQTQPSARGGRGGHGRRVPRIIALH